MKTALTLLEFCVASLLALGMVMLYSAGMEKAGARYLMMQLVWCVMGVVICVTMVTVDYRLLRKFAWPIFIVAIVLLALVLIPHFGTKVKGARRWLAYGGFRFQASELGKLALIILLAWYGEHFQRQMHTWKKGIMIPGIFIAITLGLIFVEPDRGTTILMGAVSAAMLLIAGVRWKFIVPPALAALVALGVSLFNDPMRRHRIFSWLYLEENKQGTGYQAYQAMVALGAGGWNGLGLGNGRQKLGWVPEHHTDFILSVIGEELGLVATLLIIGAFVMIVICGLYIAVNAPDTFGMLLGCGISFLIGLQAFINIGVVTSALPNKGLPLPFISYGGSNLLMMLVCVGVLLSIARQAKTKEALPRRATEVAAQPA